MQINEQILFAQATAFLVGNWSIGLWIKFVQTFECIKYSSTVFLLKSHGCMVCIKFSFICKQKNPLKLNFKFMQRQFW